MMGNGWPGLQTDALGDFVQISIDRALYSDLAVFKTAYWFTNTHFVFLDVAGDGRLRVEMRGKTPEDTAGLQGACAEFCNSLVDFRVREAVLKETAGIRESLVTKAFTEGVVRPGLAGVRSRETYVENR